MFSKIIPIVLVGILFFDATSVSAFQNLSTTGGATTGSSGSSGATPSLSQVTAVGASTADATTFSGGITASTVLATTVSSTRLLFDRGSLTQPGLAVGTNPNTGIYGAATSSLDFVVAGTNAMTINGNGILPRFSVLAFPSLGVDIGGVANIFANGYFGTVSSTALRLTGPSASVSGDSSLCRSATSGLVSFNSGATTCTVSSARFKHDIKSMDSSLDLIMSLRPVDYLRNTDNLAEHGLIAEEVEKVDKLSVFYEQDGTTPRGVKYENLVPVLIRAIQDQQKEIEALKLRVSPLEWLYNKLFK